MLWFLKLRFQNDHSLRSTDRVNHVSCRPWMAQLGRTNLQQPCSLFTKNALSGPKLTGTVAANTVEAEASCSSASTWPHPAVHPRICVFWFGAVPGNDWWLFRQADGFAHRL